MKRRFESTNPEDLALEMIRYRAYKIRKFYTHLFIYAVGVALYIAKTYFGAPFNFWPIRHINCFFMMVWTFIIAIQAVKLFFREMVFDNNWEQRKMQEFLNQEKQNKWQ